jgi:hypothetical protein
MRPESLAVCLFVLFGKLLTAQSAQPPARQNTTHRREFSMALIRNQCIEFTDVKRGDERDDLRDCRVSEFGEFGAVNGQTYYYALYCLIPNYEPGKGQCGGDSFSARYHRQRGLAVFTQDRSSSDIRLLFERVTSDIGTLLYEKPQIVSSRDGTLLYLPIALDGTGHGNESEYYLREKGEWEPIEAQEWLSDLQSRIPAGLGIWKGVWPKLDTMQAEAGLYREGDANCCPTGGTARIRLAIRSRQLVIDSVAFERGQ